MPTSEAESPENPENPFIPKARSIVERSKAVQDHSPGREQVEALILELAGYYQDLDRGLGGRYRSLGPIEADNIARRIRSVNPDQPDLDPVGKLVSALEGFGANHRQAVANARSMLEMAAKMSQSTSPAAKGDLGAYIAAEKGIHRTKNQTTGGPVGNERGAERHTKSSTTNQKGPMPRGRRPS